MSSESDANNASGDPGKPLRRIACVRCRRRKKRCDHVLPVCGECSRAGTQCLQSGVKQRGSIVTVPLAYLRQLEGAIPLQPSSSDIQPYDNATDSNHNGVEGVPSQGSSPFDPEAQTAYPSPLEDAPSQGSHRPSSAAPSAYSSSIRSLATGPGGRSYITTNSMATGEALISGSLSHEAATTNRLPADWSEHYATVYFQHMQPQWPLMDEATWDTDFALWLEGSVRLSRPRRFLVQLALSIGALVCSSFRPNCPHLHHSQELYRNALRQDFEELTRDAPMLLRTQGALLLLIYAFHDSSPEAIEQSTQPAMMNCVSLISEILVPQLQSEHNNGQKAQDISQRVIMTCHILNEVVSSAWTFSQSPMSEIIDDKIFQYVSTLQSSPDGSSVFDQLFQLRCIQSRIRHENKALRHLNIEDPLRRKCHTRLKAELEEWKQSVETLGDSESDRRPIYHNPTSLFKLYDYSLAILMLEKPSMTVVENMNQLVRCCSEALCTFQASQERDSVVYWTWAALMYQFRLGVLVLYCYSITPNTTQESDFPSQEAMRGVENCRKTLIKFSQRWPKSTVFLNAFKILTEAIFDGITFGFAGDVSTFMDYSTEPSPSQSYSSLEGDRLATLKECLLEMRLQKVHSAVISIVEEMMNALQCRGMEASQLELAPALYNGGLDLFNF